VADATAAVRTARSRDSRSILILTVPRTASGCAGRLFEREDRAEERSQEGEEVRMFGDNLPRSPGVAIYTRSYIDACLFLHRISAWKGEFRSFSSVFLPLSLPLSLERSSLFVLHNDVVRCRLSVGFLVSSAETVLASLSFRKRERERGFSCLDLSH